MYDVFLSRNVVLITANSVDPYEMPHYATFLLGLHYFAKVPIWELPYTKG